jgi:hypothetical protein
MYEELVEHVIAHLSNDFNLFCTQHNKQNEQNIRRGRLGELFIGRAIKIILLEYGFRYGETSLCSFWIEPQYGADSQHQGVDFKINIRDFDNNLHIFLIESKNLRDHYPLTRSEFEASILPRFTDYDTQHNWTWMVTLNNRHARELDILCYEHNIEIIPLDVIFTETPSNQQLTEAMEAFTTRFIDIIQEYVNCEACRRPDPNDIEQFIQRGVPDIDICSRFGISSAYLSKIKSGLKKQGMAITDRRTSRGKQIRDV